MFWVNLLYFGSILEEHKRSFDSNSFGLWECIEATQSKHHAFENQLFAINSEL